MKGKKPEKLFFFFVFGGERKVYSKVRKKKRIRYKYKNLFLVKNKSIEKMVIRKLKK